VKVSIESASQEEFDAKRADLIKAIAGTKLIVKAEPTDRATSKTPRTPYYKAQKEALKFWNEKFEEVLEDIKKKIGDVLENTK
jgi:hypothetical protein